MIFLPTNLTNLHEFIALCNNGDLYGRTNHTNAIIELVKIRATVQVAFLFPEKDSCKFVRFVGKKNIPWKNNRNNNINQ